MTSRCCLLSLTVWFVLCWSAGLHADDPNAVLVFPGANHRETYFTLHNIKAAQTISKGRGVKVGILDHSFGMRKHQKLYAGGKNLIAGREEFLAEREWHGYWMAMVVREIAPEAEIHALNVVEFDNQSATVAAMSLAIDWAIENRLDVLTCSQEAVKGEPRKILDAAMDRAHKAGILTTFIHCSHPGNIMPSGLGSGTDDGREPDVNVLHYDYTVVNVEEYRKSAAGEKTWYEPFLSYSSTSPVVGGVIALMMELKPDLTLSECKAILRDTARPLAFEGEIAPRSLDAGAAVERVRKMKESAGS